jgi:adenylate cyclase
MSNFITNIHEYFIPSIYKSNEQDYRKAKIIINTTLITTIFSLFFLGNSLMFNLPKETFFLMIICAFFFFLNVFLIKWQVPKTLVTNIYVLVAFIATFFNSYYTGGLYSFNVVWFALGPVCAVLLGTVRQGWIWLVISSFGVFILGGMQISGYTFPPTDFEQYKHLMYLNSFAGLLIIIFVVTMVMENASISSLMNVEKEQKRSDDLLLNILPDEIANELKNNGKSEPRNFEKATILFADIKNFTQISSTMKPHQLIKELEIIFGGFDEIIEKHNIEKIKIIGDAYMCVGGIPEANDTNPIDVVKAAIEMQQFIAKMSGERKTSNLQDYQIRIGINTGPIVAGIVGSKKFAYDVWGDAVNLASRMESNGEADKINISEATYQLVKDQFHCTERGLIDAKGKGEVRMYFVES